MYINQLNAMQTNRGALRQFGGLNETYGCGEAEYGEGRNFSSRDWPALSTRPVRQKIATAENVNGICHLNGLFIVQGTDIYYQPDDSADAVELEGVVTDSAKQLVCMGALVLIFPDDLIYNTSTGELTGMNADWSIATGGAITIQLCDVEGNTYDSVDSYGTELPTDHEDGDLFLLCEDTSYPDASTSRLYIYSDTIGDWYEISLNYCKISADGIGENFEQYDTVTLANILTEDYVIKAAAGLLPAATNSILSMVGDLNEDKILYQVEDDAIVVSCSWDEGSCHWGTVTGTMGETFASWSFTGLASGSTVSLGTSEGTISAKREAPELDYVCECDNRVWGVNSEQNVIYACALGDATNWFSYRGTAADSYALTVGSDGDFTGIASCLGYVLAFKENVLHKIYGSKPSDYQLSTVHCRGVAAGCAESLTVIDEALYYLAPTAVMTWSGSLPGVVSAALDPDKLTGVTDAAGGTLDGRYYLWTKDTDEAERLLVYDTARGIWHEEEALGERMVSTARQLLIYSAEEIWAVDAARETFLTPESDAETGVDFDWQSGDIGLDTPDDKYVSRVTLRLDAAADSIVSIQASYDGGPWKVLAEKYAGKNFLRINLPFVPQRHDLMRLRLCGHGQITLRSVAMTLAASKGNMTKGAL